MGAAIKNGTKIDEKVILLAVSARFLCRILGSQTCCGRIGRHRVGHKICQHSLQPIDRTNAQDNRLPLVDQAQDGADDKSDEYCPPCRCRQKPQLQETGRGACHQTYLTPEPPDQARRVVAVSTHLLDIGVKLINKRRHRQRHLHLRRLA